MFLELETECMRVYRRKVDSANAERAQLRQSLMAKEAELKALVSSIGENTTQFKVFFFHSLYFCLFLKCYPMDLQYALIM
jgi:hypothetical protein